jgi:hypothetical protein
MQPFQSATYESRLMMKLDEDDRYNDNKIRNKDEMLQKEGRSKQLFTSAFIAMQQQHADDLFLSVRRESLIG